MSTVRELANARRDYDRQIREATPSWWRSAWSALVDLARTIADDLGGQPMSRRARADRKAAVERAAKERL